MQDMRDLECGYTYRWREKSVRLLTIEEGIATCADTESHEYFGQSPLLDLSAYEKKYKLPFEELCEGSAITEMDDAYAAVQEEVEALAREELGAEATEEEVYELSWEIFMLNRGSYMDLCNCSDPGCPCGGVKWGTL